MKSVDTARLPAHMGMRSTELGHGSETFLRERVRCSPHDPWFREVRRGNEDARLLALTDAWIKSLERNYAELVDGISATWPDHAELDLEAVAGRPHEAAGHESTRARDFRARPTCSCAAV